MGQRERKGGYALPIDMIIISKKHSMYGHKSKQSFFKAF